MDERQRSELWQAIDDYADQRTLASRAVVERVVVGIEAKWANGLRRVLEEQPPLVPNANGDVLPHIEFKVVPVADLPESPVPLWMPEDVVQPRDVLTVPERLSERFMREVDAKILAEIEQTVAGLPKPEDLP